MSIHPFWYAGLRSAMQGFWAMILAGLAKLGISLPDFLGNWIVEAVLVAGVIAGVVALLRWMESRPDDNLVNRALRWIAKVLMAGLAKPPAYPLTAPPAGTLPEAIKYEDGRSRTTM